MGGGGTAAGWRYCAVYLWAGYEGSSPTESTASTARSSPTAGGGAYSSNLLSALGVDRMKVLLPSEQSKRTFLLADLW